MAALRRLYSLFILPDGNSAERPPQSPLQSAFSSVSASASASESASPSLSPIRYLLSLNRNSFRPRCSVPGVVALSPHERKLDYFALLPATSAGDSAVVPPTSSTSASEASASYRLVRREPPYLFVGLKLPDEYSLVAAGSSSALCAFFMLHWRSDGGETDAGANAGRTPQNGNEYEYEYEHLYGSPPFPRAAARAAATASGRLVGSGPGAPQSQSCRTVLSLCFPNKLALCMTSGLAERAVPRRECAIVMVRVHCSLITVSVQ